MPALRTPEPRNVPGAVFEPAGVDRVIAALRSLKHTQGKWAGQPLQPDPWQVAYVLAPTFGWLAPDDEDDGRLARIIRSLFVEVPRKNGKTTIASGLALYLAFGDGEPGAQVLAVAGSERQARHVFTPAAQLARSSAQLKAAGVRALQSRIERGSDGSYLEVAASVGDLLHGANVHGAAVDELHVHKSPDVLDAVESGTGARRQPLVAIITTADDGRTDTTYAKRREYIERLASGVITDPGTYGVVFAADEADDPFAEETLRKANPGYGVSPSKAFLAGEARKAQQSEAHLGRYLRLHLGIRAGQGRRFLDLVAWDRNASLVDERALAGRTAFGGLDLASTADIIALCWAFPDDGSAGEVGFDVIWRCWTPEANLRALDERTAGAASSWVRNGHLVATPGEVADYGYVKKQVISDLETFDVVELAYNPWNAGTGLVTDLLAEGAPMVTMRPGYATMSAPLKELQRLLRAGTPKRPLVRHGGNPLARWSVDNLAVDLSPEGDVKPSRKNSRDKIDPAVALAQAIGRATAAEQQGDSVYETENLEVV